MGVQANGFSGRSFKLDGRVFQGLGLSRMGTSTGPVARFMIFRRRFLDGLRDGSITLAFRRWRRPSVRTGGTLLTAVGQLEIVSVAPVRRDAISDADARRAGYESRDALLSDLDRRDEGGLYRVELGALRSDPRVALRQSVPSTSAERASLLERLRRLDGRSAQGPWTRRTLELVRAHPGVRAADLARRLNQETPHFKVNVRKLKSLGLTESLEVGYRLAPRGSSLLRWLEDQE
jgi:hypothetical protein